ncbi:glycosyltransferase [Listeria booriae]|uniref:glycosyltransferase n=1 Tax=Listeria booriae TaxID=1552123 RepID=UPI001624D43D|nr:nucleotide disphospho-sugar-binding domain-containing protein [Listeria booriae]MBC2323927.1 hypothetical protein [Listeria booriae]
MIRIDFIAPPVSGHLFPMLYLAKQLQLEAPNQYDIHFISGLSKREVIEATGFPVHVLMPEDPYIFDRLADVESGMPMIHQMNEVSRYIGVFTEQIRLALIERDTQIAVVDFVTYAGAFAADELEIPWITCIPTPFAIENRDGTPAFLGGLYPPKSWLGKMRDFGGRLLIHGIKQVLIYKNRRLLSPFVPPLYDLEKRERIYSTYSILALGLPSFQFERSWPEQLQFVGYGAMNETRQLDIPFDNFKHSILVSMGTMMPKENERIQELVREVAIAFPDILFVFSGGDSNNYAIQQFENIMIVGFVPYDDYLPQFDFVIHHGGAGIVHMCIKYGKPAIVIPKYNDQPDFAARVDYFDIGIWLRRVNTKHLQAAIVELMARENWPAFKQLQIEAASLEMGKAINDEIKRLLNIRREAEQK